MKKFPATIVVGRFQLPHKPHVNLIKTALDHGEKVVILLGSSYHARTIKNCFTWEEREQMLRLCFSDSENERLNFVPIRDYHDNKTWFEVAHRKVHNVVGDIRDSEMRVVGFYKDASSFYLKQLPWDTIDAGSTMKVDATDLRKVLYEADDVRSAISVLTSYVPAPILSYIKSWSVLPYLANMKAEYEKIQSENRSYGGKYGLTGDFILHFNDYVLLVKRGRWPGKGLVAIPGGFYEPDNNETLFQCALREAFEETQHSIWEPRLREAYQGRQFFDGPNRSVRRNIFTMMHYFRMTGPELPSIRGSVDHGESEPAFFHVSELPMMESQFFDDHFMGLHHFLKFPIED